jgi:two-component system response regulator
MSKKLILLVEDNPDDEELTLVALKQNRILNEIIVVHDGAEALEYLLGSESSPARTLPTLILLDLKLPKIDGLEVLRRMRHEKRTKLVPVVVLTSSKEETDLVQSYSLGANSYIRKPVDFGNFTEAIRALGMYWLVLNEPPPEA